MTVNWEELFRPHGSLLELVLRGTLMYLLLFVVLRVLVKRHVGGLGISDLLMIVLIADAAQNGMAGEYKSITEGVILCATVIFWSHALDWLTYRFKFMQKLLEPAPLALVRNGMIQRKNLKQEMITEDELMSNLREHGIDDVKMVRLAFAEPDGQISVIRKDAAGETAKPPKHKKHQGAL